MWIDVPCRRRGSTVLRADNKNETISLRRHRGPASPERGNESGTRAEEAFPRRNPPTSSSNFCPAYASVLPFPHHDSPAGRGVKPPHRAARFDCQPTRRTFAWRKSPWKPTKSVARDCSKQLSAAQFHARASSMLSLWPTRRMRREFPLRGGIKIHPSARDHPNCCARFEKFFRTAWLEDVGRCWKMFEAVSKGWDWIPWSSEI